MKDYHSAMYVFLRSHYFFPPGYSHPLFCRNPPTAPILLYPHSKAPPSPSKTISFSNPRPNSSHLDSSPSCDGDGDDRDGESQPSASSIDWEFGIASGEAAEIEVEKNGRNSRKISSRIGIDASLETVWNILTDYERLADFIPGLAVSQLLEKKENFAKLFQVGQQNLAFGLKFNAKGIVDSYERDLEHLSFGLKRDIDFKMVEGDFQTFEGKWSIIQVDKGHCKEGNLSYKQEFQTVLLYVVDVVPKMWLPVSLVEGRLCKEIEVNLTCIRDEAQRQTLSTLPT